MAQGKQAKRLNAKQQQQLLDHVAHRRYPLRDRVMVLLSYRAGLRAIEMAKLKWSMVTDPDGNVADVISLTNNASKGKGGGRTIPIHPELRDALVVLQDNWSVETDPIPDDPILLSERGGHFRPAAIVIWFLRRYEELRFEGASSHSGRRTFITGAAKKISDAGGSIRDVQQLAGHASLATTQRYIDGDNEAKRRVVAML